MKLGTQKLGQAASCLLCVIVAWRHMDDFGASEFSGGWLTGTIFSMFDDGSLAFILAWLLTFFFRRIAAAIALMASLLCLPLYLYITAPGPFRSVFRGEYSVPLQTNFVWDRWAAFGILTLVVATCVSIWNLKTPAFESKPSPGSPEQHRNSRTA
jgi:hypothetical protein